MVGRDGLLYDGEVLLTLSRLLQFHHPWQGEDLHSPDYRMVNEYLMDMARIFTLLHQQQETDWGKVDLLDKLNEHVLQYTATRGLPWDK